MENLKVIYIVSYFFSPLNNARSNRWTSIAEELCRRGYKVIVIAGWQPGLSSSEIVKGVNVYRVGFKFLEKIRNSLHKNKPSINGEYVPSSKSLNYYIGKIFLNLAWPDTTCFWIFSSILKILKLSKGSRIQVLISVSPTFSSIVTGLVLKKKADKFILDIGDPFALSNDAPANNFKLYGSLNRFIEGYACRSANYISITNSYYQKRINLNKP